MCFLCYWLSILSELTYVQGGVHLELTGNLKNVEARNPQDS